MDNEAGSRNKSAAHNKIGGQSAADTQNKVVEQSAADTQNKVVPPIAATSQDASKLQGQSVQSTMLLALYGRAKASRLFSDILCDDEAIRIVDGMDYDFAQIDKSYATEYASLCCLLRAKRFDERCRTYMREHPDGAIINLGSGLDTTFNRVDNGSVRWYNLDLPDAMTFRHQLIPASARCIDIAKSMFDYTWPGEVKTADNSVLIIAGGLFYYFKETQLRELFNRITTHFPTGELFFDAQSKTATSISNRMVRKSGNSGSTMYFYVNDTQRLKSWSPKIRKVETIPFFEGLWREKRFKLSSRIQMWGLDKLKMGFLVSLLWENTAK
ncbi:MAG: class I SAM-dependent methyltransferase [Coriobacteriales bacterium]|jgi:O-methyltransferase involved in polyketide biosynthesis|nr:class I SAM-dependent methyltransferase [Coriobacteriales bacterium]